MNFIFFLKVFCIIPIYKVSGMQYPLPPTGARPAFNRKTKGMLNWKKDIKIPWHMNNSGFIRKSLAASISLLNT